MKPIKLPGSPWAVIAWSLAIMLVLTLYKGWRFDRAEKDCDAHHGKLVATAAWHWVCFDKGAVR